MPSLEIKGPALRCCKNSAASCCLVGDFQPLVIETQSECLQMCTKGTANDSQKEGMMPATKDIRQCPQLISQVTKLTAHPSRRLIEAVKQSTRVLNLLCPRSHFQKHPQFWGRVLLAELPHAMEPGDNPLLGAKDEEFAQDLLDLRRQQGLDAIVLDMLLEARIPAKTWNLVVLLQKKAHFLGLGTG